MTFDFADDIIVLMHDTWVRMQNMTTALEIEAKKVGLNINEEKTKIMSVGNWPTTEKKKLATKNWKNVENCVTITCMADVKERL